MFTVRLLRGIVIEGQRWLPGAQLKADAVAAAELIRAGTACLADEAELPRLAAALRQAPAAAATQPHLSVRR